MLIYDAFSGCCTHSLYVATPEEILCSIDYFPLPVDAMHLVPIHQPQQAFANDTLRYREAFIVKLYFLNRQIGEEENKKQSKSLTVLFRLFARFNALYPIMYDELVGSYPMTHPELHPMLWDKQVGSYPVRQLNPMMYNKPVESCPMI
jgi:hypothetical protein